MLQRSCIDLSMYIVTTVMRFLLSTTVRDRLCIKTLVLQTIFTDDSHSQTSVSHSIKSSVVLLCSFTGVSPSCRYSIACIWNVLARWFNDSFCRYIIDVGVKTYYLYPWRWFIAVYSSHGCSLYSYLFVLLYVLCTVYLSSMYWIG